MKVTMLDSVNFIQLFLVKLWNIEIVKKHRHVHCEKF